MRALLELISAGRAKDCKQQIINLSLSLSKNISLSLKHYIKLTHVNYYDALLKLDKLKNMLLN